MAHEAAVAGDIGCEDGSQPSCDPRFGHGIVLSETEISGSL
jgi:hypothetical protein